MPSSWCGSIDDVLPSYERTHSRSPKQRSTEQKSKPSPKSIPTFTSWMKRKAKLEDKEHRHPSPMQSTSSSEHRTREYPPDAVLRQCGEPQDSFAAPLLPSSGSTVDVSPQCEGNTHSDSPWQAIGSMEFHTVLPCWKNQNNELAASNREDSSYSSRDSYNRSKVENSYFYSAPPPGSYLDDDTGPSPKLLSMAVMGVKSAVNLLARNLISDMKNHPDALEALKAKIDSEVSVERTNHGKFRVQAYICDQLFDAFMSKNGCYGSENFDKNPRWRQSCFDDYTRFKDKAATISMLLSNKPLSHSGADSSIENYCFEKFKLICGDPGTNQPFPLYEDIWRIVCEQQHPNTEFYRNFLRVAVSGWLLHRLTHSFTHQWNMITSGTGAPFDRNCMESVVPGVYEEEDEDSDANVVVGFLVIPGFQVSRSIVKCEVYLHSKHRDDDERKSPVKTLNQRKVDSRTPDSNSFRSNQYYHSIPRNRMEGPCPTTPKRKCRNTNVYSSSFKSSPGFERPTQSSLSKSKLSPRPQYY